YDQPTPPHTPDPTPPGTTPAPVTAAADVTVLISNAGANPPSASLLDVTEADIRANMETNFFGPVFLARAFAPILTAKPESVLVDVHSVASWYAFGGIYSASKAALWSATNSLRIELAPKGVHVTGVHMGYVDTPMAAHADGPKMGPAQLVTTVYDAVEAGEYEVLADELTAQVKAALSGPVEALYPDLRSTNA
ncbi:SDR family NAD(P)-dependent oxidoreductase, partial [Streptomyces sp. NPDC002920]